MPGVGQKLVSLADARARRALASGSTLGHLAADDPRWNCRMVVELASETFDPDYLGIGSTPWGDATGFGVRIPPEPTLDYSHRYLIRLCQVEISPRRAVVIRGIWQYATIRCLPEQREPDCEQVPVELEITSPEWHFADGNISWHLRWEPTRFSPESVFDANQLPGTSPSISGQDTALLYLPPFAPTYTPPGAGIPPGADVQLLGTIRELRYTERSDRELSVPVIGPGRVTFYASVHQTNPETRCAINIPPGVGRPEDQFVAAFEADEEEVRYGRVAGGIAVELFPCCEDLEKGC